MKDNNFIPLLKELREKYGSLHVLENELLSKHTTMRVGGIARIYFIAASLDSIVFAVQKAKKYSIPYFILGGGTNLIADDSGFDGLIIKNEYKKITVKNYGGSFSKGKIKKVTVEVEVGSGALVNQLVRFTLEENISGLEAFLGQPGTVGGAVYINAHNMKMHEFFGDKIKKALLLKKDGTLDEVSRSYFCFGYDESLIQKTKDVILSVTLKLTREGKDNLWDKATRAMEYRKNTQPAGFGSSGCTFRNISKSDAMRVGIPNGITSAGFLLEAVGLKSYQVGQAKFSDRHANFILNLGNAKSKDIKKLIEIGKSRVKKRFNIDLKEEIVYLTNK